MRIQKTKGVKQQNYSLQDTLTKGRVVWPELLEEYADKETYGLSELFQILSEKSLSNQVLSSP